MEKGGDLSLDFKFNNEHFFVKMALNEGGRERNSAGAVT